MRPDIRMNYGNYKKYESPCKPVQSKFIEEEEEEDDYFPLSDELILKPPVSF